MRDVFETDDVIGYLLGIVAMRVWLLTHRLSAPDKIDLGHKVTLVNVRRPRFNAKSHGQNQLVLEDSRLFTLFSDIASYIIRESLEDVHIPVQAWLKFEEL